MKVRRFVLRAAVGLALIVLLFEGLWYLRFGRSGTRGKVLGSWESANGVFKIRVSEYEEAHPILLSHFCYVFESRSPGSNVWREIAQDWVDDDSGQPEDAVKFVADRIGYIAMGNVYAVSTDAGANWSVWETEHRYPPIRDSLTYIKTVVVEPDGKGSMQVGGKGGPLVPTKPELKTTDFGVTWKLVCGGT